jgi:hypothetical protein
MCGGSTDFPEGQVQLYDIIQEGHVYICIWFVSNLKKLTEAAYRLIRQSFKFGVLELLYLICSVDGLTY